MAPILCYLGSNSEHEAAHNDHRDNLNAGGLTILNENISNATEKVLPFMHRIKIASSAIAYALQAAAGPVKLDAESCG